MSKYGISLRYFDNLLSFVYRGKHDAFWIRFFCQASHGQAISQMDMSCDSSMMFHDIIHHRLIDSLIYANFI